MSSSPEQRQGLLYSAGIHLILLLLAIFGLPELFALTRDPEPAVITVELLPVSDKPNAPNVVKSTPKPKPKPVVEPPKPKETPKPVEKPKPVETPKPVEKPKPVETPKPKDKPKPKEPEESLDKILEEVKNTAQKDQKKEKPSEAQDTPSDKTIKSTAPHDPTIPLSQGEKDFIRNQFIKCWNPPIGAANAETLVVVIHAQFLQDGQLTGTPEISSDKSRLGDPTYRAAAESALRAVQQCSPLKDLPPEKYGTWGDLELTFDPKDML